MAKYGSNRKKLNSFSGLSSERYKYVGLEDVEPNLGYPGEKTIPLSSKYYNLITIENSGVSDRYWQEIAPATFTGGISIFDEGFLVGTANSVSKINFVGSAVTATASGDISTITVFAPGKNGELIFNDNGEFNSTTDVIYNSSNNFIGIGTTIPQVVYGKKL